jgi:hypothetical protein
MSKNLILEKLIRAICLFDTETGKRFRCIREGHKSRPNALSLLPSKFGDQQFSTGAENGEVGTTTFYRYANMNEILRLKCGTSVKQSRKLQSSMIKKM